MLCPRAQSRSSEFPSVVILTLFHQLLEAFLATNAPRVNCIICPRISTPICNILQYRYLTMCTFEMYSFFAHNVPLNNCQCHARYDNGYAFSLTLSRRRLFPKQTQNKFQLYCKCIWAFHSELISNIFYVCIPCFLDVSDPGIQIK